VAARHAVAAVAPLAEGEISAPDRHFRPIRYGLGGEDRAQDLEHRQIEALIAAEEARPGAAPEDNRPSSGAPLLRDHARHPPARRRAMSSARTAHCSTILAPCLRAWTAMAGTAFCGSARPSLWVSRAPAKRRVIPGSIFPSSSEVRSREVT